MKTVTQRNTLLIIIMCLFCQGCKKILNVNEPVDKIINEKMFINDESAESAIRGIYSAASGTSDILSGAATIYPGIYSDELMYTGTNITLAEFYNSKISTDNVAIENIFWGNTYRFIYQINACLEELGKANAVTTRMKNQLTGECRFLRALLYFHLIELFGDVPLITKTDYKINENIARTNIELVRKNILDDLLQAKELLSTAYPTAERVRVNKCAVQALLSRYYLYQRDWIQAEKEASEVIDAGIYHLDNVNNVFLANSVEAILQIRPVLTGYNTMEGNMLIPTGPFRPTFALTASLLNSFEANDKRKDVWLNSKISNGIIYYYPYKYKQRANFTNSFKLTEYSIVLRLAEMYLIRAECRTSLGLLPAAIRDLDSVRARAGLPLIAVTNPDISGTALTEKIQRERQIEFFAEWGHRWSDLRRTGKAYETMIKVKEGWTESRKLWPVPNVQIVLNPLLYQNDGYY